MTDGCGVPECHNEPGALATDLGESYDQPVADILGSLWHS